MKKVGRIKKGFIKTLHTIGFKPKTLMDIFKISKATFYRHIK